MPCSSEIYPIAVIGGGPVGLSASILLSVRGIQHVLFERRSTTSTLPRSCGINQRTMEVFRGVGIEDAIRAVAGPPEVTGRTAWYTSIGPDGREIVSRDSWGAGQYVDEYSKHSPSQYTILPQIRLEPVLQQRAQELNHAGIKYRAEVTDVREEGDSHAVLKVRFDDGETEEDVRARFVICADGGRSFTDKLGVRWLGEHNLYSMVSAHFRAPLSQHHPDPRNFITWFTHPDLGGSMKTGFLYQIGPWPYKPETGEEWVFVCMPTATDPERFDSEALAHRIHNTLQLPDLPIDMISHGPWTVNACYAERYRATKRILLTGDAAHRIPPWGALGMNTGVQDAANLVWKLDLALHDEAKYGPLLDSYDAERRPIGAHVGRTSLHNMRSHALCMDAALGMSAAASPAVNRAALAPFFDPAHPEYAAKRTAVQAALKTLDSEFKAPGTEVGWFYPSVDLDNEGATSRHGGQLRADGHLETEFYFPSTIPGHHIPHAWLCRHGEKVAVIDLVPLRQLLLLARQRGLGWELLQSTLVKLEVIGGDDGNWVDIDGAWTRQCGVSERGAILVRPDGIVAWRGEWQDALKDSGKWGLVLERVLWLSASSRLTITKPRL
ncbi:FAD binding domain-containing protein [Fomitopsis betulina]|nr:FAD binding domain-containing protein [Fomitopsis betulina]